MNIQDPQNKFPRHPEAIAALSTLIYKAVAKETPTQDDLSRARQARKLLEADCVMVEMKY